MSVDQESFQSSSAGVFHAEHLAAMEKVRGELTSMQEAAFLPITTDPVTAANVVLATYAARSKLVDAIRESVPKFPIESLERVRTLALALLWADGYYALSARGAEKLPRLDVQAAKYQSLLMATAQALAEAGAIDGAGLSGLPTTHGYRNRVRVLSALDALFRSRWEQLADKVPFKVGLLDSTLATVREMGELLAVRDRTSPTLTEAARSRQAVYTLLLREWPAVQRVVNFVRGASGDGDTFAPSLFVRAAPERKKKANGASAEAATPAVTARPVAAETNVIASNLPGGSPFIA